MLASADNQQVLSIREPLQRKKVRGGELATLSTIDLKQVHLPRSVVVGQVPAIAGNRRIENPITGCIGCELPANDFSLWPWYWFAALYSPHNCHAPQKHKKD